MRLTFQKITGVQIQASTIFSVFRYPFILKEVANWMHVDCNDKSYAENLRAKATQFRDKYFTDSVGQELIKKYMFSKFQVLDEGEFMDNQFLHFHDMFLRVIRCNDKPFGGLQTIIIGDVLQFISQSRPADKDVQAIKSVTGNIFCENNLEIFTSSNIFLKEFKIGLLYGFGHRFVSLENDKPLDTAE
jgi:hypothetical protein